MHYFNKFVKVFV